MVEGVTGSLGSKKSGRPSQSCRVYFSVIEPRLRLFRFAVFTEVDLVPYAPPALANVEWFFQYIYRLEGLPEMLRTAFFCYRGGWSATRLAGPDALWRGSADCREDHVLRNADDLNLRVGYSTASVPTWSARMQSPPFPDRRAWLNLGDPCAFPWCQ